MSDSILQWADIKIFLNLRTDDCTKDHGDTLLQPGDDPDSLTSMGRTHEWRWLWILINTFYSTKITSLWICSSPHYAKRKYYVFILMESLSLNFVIQKWWPFLWGQAFTAITDYRALQCIFTYDGNNTAVRYLQFGILGFNFNAVHRPYYSNKDTYGLSQLGINTNLDANLSGRYSDDPSLNQYYRLSIQL